MFHKEKSYGWLCVQWKSPKRPTTTHHQKTSLCELEVVRTIETSVFLMKKSRMLQNVTMGMLDILCVLSPLRAPEA
jgi:hypothetical protein